MPAFIPDNPRAGARDDTVCTIEIDGTTVADVSQWSYVSDVLSLSDPFSVTVPDPRGRWRNVVTIPSGDAPKRTVFKLANPNILDGKPTVKVDGLIVKATRDSAEGRGTIISVEGADLGWHLVNNDAPLWFNLTHTTFQRLLDACIFPERIFRGRGSTATGWGFQGVRTENGTNRRLKHGRQGALLNTYPPALRPLARIQAEPGQPIADLLVLYARRVGLLVNVSADRYLQAFAPDYRTRAAYRLEYHPEDSVEHTRNNVIAAHDSQDITSIWTDITLVGEVLHPDTTDESLAKDNVNAGKFRGRALHADALPFLHRKTTSDGEQYSRNLAGNKAEWHYKRGLFDSDGATYEVRGHGQGGVWWEADTMVEVNDTVNGRVGTYYVSRVECSRTEQAGDRTRITVKRPNLLTVSA